MRDFLQRNRNDPRTSPQLALEHDRLQRRIDDASQVVTSLTQSLEQARIDEVRDTPVITVIEAPSMPTEPAGLSFVLRIAAALVGGLFIALAVGVVRYLLSLLERSDPEGYRDLRSALWGGRIRASASRKVDGL